jgi:hypothetical protein
MSGQKLAEFHGLTIYGKLKKAKREGKDRIWIQIRQEAHKPFRVYETLSYARSVDIQFVVEPHWR